MNLGINPLAFVVSIVCILLALTSRLWLPAGDAYLGVSAILLFIAVMAPLSMRMAQQ